MKFWVSDALGFTFFLCSFGLLATLKGLHKALLGNQAHHVGRALYYLSFFLKLRYPLIRFVLQGYNFSSNKTPTGNILPSTGGSSRSFPKKLKPTRPAKEDLRAKLKKMEAVLCKMFAAQVGDGHSLYLMFLSSTYLRISHLAPADHLSAQIV